MRSCGILASPHERSNYAIGRYAKGTINRAYSLGGSACGAGVGQPLDKITFGSNWVAEAEHGGFYQAVADGTYKKYGLDVTILPGGPNANNRMLLLVNKIDFYLSANTLQGFDAVAHNVPTIQVAALFQKDPQVLIAHPDAGVGKFADLKKLTLFISKEGMATYYQWLKADFGFKTIRSNLTPSTRSRFLPTRIARCRAT